MDAASADTCWTEAALKLGRPQMAALAALEVEDFVRESPVFATERDHARRAVLEFELDPRPATRWALLTTTTPSGKALFRCGTCGAVTPCPNKTCSAGCREPED